MLVIGLVLLSVGQCYGKTQTIYAITNGTGKGNIANALPEPTSEPSPAVTTINNVGYPLLDIRHLPGVVENLNTTKYLLAEGKDHVTQGNPKAVGSTLIPTVFIEVFDYQDLIRIDPTRVSVKEGSNTKFNCSVSTPYDRAAVTWYRKDIPLSKLSFFQKLFKFQIEKGRGQTNQDGFTTCWSVLQLRNVGQDDSGIYTCAENLTGQKKDAMLVVTARTPCTSDEDCRVTGSQCVNYKCNFEQPRESIDNTDGQMSYYTLGLRFVIAAFICGGIVIAVVLFFILFRQLCSKICCRKPQRRNSQTRNQFVYVIRRRSNESIKSDKPPSYEICLKENKAKAKEETPPPSYRQPKARVFPPPPYDVTGTTPPLATSSPVPTSSGEGTSTTPKEIRAKLEASGTSRP